MMGRRPTTNGHAVTVEQLEAAIESHNRRHWRWMWLCAAGAVVLWGFSYGFVFLVAMILNVVVLREAPDWATLHLITAGVMALLLIEAVRGGRGMLRQRTKREELLRWTDYTYPRPLTPFYYRQMAFGVSELLLCAPRCTLAALRHARSRVRYGLADVERAAALLAKLERSSSWHEAGRLGGDVETLDLLEAAGVLLHRGDEQGRREVRINHEACRRLAEATV